VLAVATWPDVGLALIAALPALLAAVFSFLNNQRLKTPSGEKLGVLAERAHDLIAVGVAQNTALLKAANVPDPNGLEPSQPPPAG